MHMHKSLHWILGIVGALLIFGVGFYIGTLDADAHEIKITSQCSPEVAISSIKEVASAL